MAGVFRCVRRALKLDALREAGRQYPLFCCVLLSMLSMTVLLNRYIHILMVFWSFLAGVITFYCSIGPDTLLPNIFLSVKPRNKADSAAGELPAMAGPEGSFEGGRFDRRGQRRHTWTVKLQIQSVFNVLSSAAFFVSQVFELVLENFVYPWYRDITDDEACVDELRMTFRFFASVLVRRAQKIDVPALMAGKVMKAAMKHIEQAALDEYGADLHIALRSRKDELLYLRKLTEMLFPYVMPPKATDCRTCLNVCHSGQDTVNLMVLIYVDDTPPEPAVDPPSVLVPFLQKYADVSNKKPSVLKLELKEIRDQQDLLFRFMNFLKQEGAVHVLQFCLTVEEFNDKILSPDLSDAELQRLHGEVLHIYETYCLDESIDKISFDKFIVEEIRNIATGPYGDVVKLQTMHCLFEAYEHVLSLLERVFTPMFCHSDERGESFGISRIGSKIKGVFKSTTMEGAMLPPSAMGDFDDDLVEEATVVMEDDSPAEPASTPGTLRNLSAWSISIPYIDSYDDEVKREKIPVFCIDVERNDRKEVGHEPERWSIYRRYLEFYVLESKLTEFHGTFADAQLPSKRIIGPKNYEFLASKREEFEEYLQKGQNLEPFIQSFFNSCEAPKPKPSRPELTILSPSAENNKKLFSDLFKNNANLSESLERKHNHNYFLEKISVDGMYDCMMFIGRTVFRISDWLHHVLAAGRIVLKSSFEAYMDQYMQLKLEQILQEHHMVSLITQLRDAVFCESCEERTVEDKQSRAKRTFEEMMKYLPDFVGKCIGEEAKYEGIRFLFDGLQQPLLNKQMTYVLLDVAVQELFPELAKRMPTVIVLDFLCMNPHCDTVSSFLETSGHRDSNCLIRFVSV
ncbi:Sorting nexin-14 [Collichthys lucidus]|uniref:Sorting nexin-14 n=1 Tax=Collichthys lucidus TaxID=240159 RepID=A0A4U5UKE3_COLLU|nr:Sorting nexin-14 [Collichthys lucidus]